MAADNDRTPSWLTAFLDFPAPEFDAGARFWCSATGYELSAPRGQDAEFATLVPGGGDAYLKVQRLAEGHTRLHLDLHVADPVESARWAESLGAELVEESRHGYVILRSPAGLTFCLVGHAGQEVPPPAEWPTGQESRVVQVCLDVPRRWFATEVEFWQRLLGGWWLELEDAEIVIRQAGDSALSLRLKPAEITPEVAAHLHLVTDGRRQEVARLVGLGAVERAMRPSKSILEAPGGLAVCVVDEEGEGGTCRL